MEIAYHIFCWPGWCLCYCGAIVRSEADGCGRAVRCCIVSAVLVGWAPRGVRHDIIAEIQWERSASHISTRPAARCLPALPANPSRATRYKTRSSRWLPDKTRLRLQASAASVPIFPGLHSIAATQWPRSRHPPRCFAQSRRQQHIHGLRLPIPTRCKCQEFTSMA